MPPGPGRGPAPRPLRNRPPAAPRRELGYRLRVNVTRLCGPFHPDRDARFTFIEALGAACRAEGLPILSADTKKKELVGNFANAGATWPREADQVTATHPGAPPSPHA